MAIVSVLLAASVAQGSSRIQAQTLAFPTLRFDKTTFSTAESVRFWIGVSRIDVPIPEELRGTMSVTVTRPDGTVKVDRPSWPIDGNKDRGGWSGGWGLGASELQTGRHMVVVEFAGQRTAPGFFTVESTPLLERIEAAFMFPTMLVFDEGERVTLSVRNGSPDTIRFPHPGGLFGPVSGLIGRKSEPRWTSGFFVPDEVLVEATGFAPSPFDQEGLGWDSVREIPMVTLAPGAVYALELPIASILAGADSFAGGFTPGDYEIRLETTLRVFVGDRGGTWGSVSPLRLDVSSSASGRIVE